MPTLDLHEAALPLAPALHVPRALRAATQATWRGRMVNEHGSAVVFEGLAAQLEAAGWDAADVGECRSFAAEERRHGVLCGAVVIGAGGRAVAEVPAPEAFPAHDDASRLEAAARSLASFSWWAESVAVALIGAARDALPEGPLRVLLTTIWADEVGHARFGWRVLARLVPALTPPERARLERYLAVALAHLERHELAHLPLAAVRRPGGDALGLCSGAEARELFYATVERAIVPGLERLGLGAGAAWAGRARAA